VFNQVIHLFTPKNVPKTNDVTAATVKKNKIIAALPYPLNLLIIIYRIQKIKADTVIKANMVAKNMSPV
jgi:hypothetical protein